MDVSEGYRQAIRNRIAVDWSRVNGRSGLLDKPRCPRPVSILLLDEPDAHLHMIL